MVRSSTSTTPVSAKDAAVWSRAARSCSPTRWSIPARTSPAVSGGMSHTSRTIPSDCGTSASDRRCRRIASRGSAPSSSSRSRTRRARPCTCRTVKPGACCTNTCSPAARAEAEQYGAAWSSSRTITAPASTPSAKVSTAPASVGYRAGNGDPSNATRGRTAIPTSHNRRASATLICHNSARNDPGAA